MTPDFEGNCFRVKRTATGSVMGRDIHPKEWWIGDFDYTCPRYDLRISFNGVHLKEPTTVDAFGARRTWEIEAGVVVIRGEIAEKIREAKRNQLSSKEVAALVEECYELLAEQVRTHYERAAWFAFAFDVYEADQRQVWELRDRRDGVGGPARHADLTTITELGATLVYRYEPAWVGPDIRPLPEIRKAAGERN
jgi:hypothetical protein